MNKYNIYYDKNSDKFKACLDSNKKIESYDALPIIQNLDNIDFNKIKISENSMNLSNDTISCDFFDLNKFSDKKLFLKIPNLLKKIYNTIFHFQIRNINKNANIVINKKRIKATCSLILTSFLLFEGTKINTIKDEEFIIEQESETDDKVVKNDPQISVINNEHNFVKEEQHVSVLLENIPIEKIVYFNYSDLTNSNKYFHARDNYYEIIDKYSKKWGLDTELMMAMLTQETGGYYTNLMAISFSSCEGSVFTAYNFEEEKYESFIFSNNPNIKSTNDIKVIRKKDLNDPEINISMGCIIFRSCLKKMNYHIAASVCCYNQGSGNMRKIFRETYNKTGIEKEEILADQSNLAFVDYMYASRSGDKNYLRNVFKYMENEDVNIKILNEENKIEDLTVNYKREEYQK